MRPILVRLKVDGWVKIGTAGATRMFTRMDTKIGTCMGCVPHDFFFPRNASVT